MRQAMRQGLLSTIAAAGLMSGLHLPASAQGAASFPNKPITIIVPFPAGGTADVLPRIVGQKLSEKWGQPVVIENRSGAGGNIGAQAVAKAAPDGYTLLATPPAPLAINQNLYKNLGYEPERFVPITVLAAVPNVLAVRSTLPVSNTKEFIAYAKKEDGNVTAATQGNGTTSHLTATLFSTQTGAKFTFVPYKGTAPALSDLMGGQVDVFFDNISSSYRHHEAGKVKILAVASASRSPLLPNVPTIAETDLPQFNSTTWFAVAAPPGTPDDIAQKLNSAIVEVLKMKDVRQKFLDQGAEVVGNTQKQMGEFVANERTRWKKVIDSAGVTMN
jgi:tripartite-type tricarboxylate transporter receptor subunit TctC